MKFGNPHELSHRKNWWDFWLRFYMHKVLLDMQKQRGKLNFLSDVVALLDPPRSKRLYPKLRVLFASIYWPCLEWILNQNILKVKLHRINNKFCNYPVGIWLNSHDILLFHKNSSWAFNANMGPKTNFSEHHLWHMLTILIQGPHPRSFDSETPRVVSQECHLYK